MTMLADLPGLWRLARAAAPGTKVFRGQSASPLPQPVGRAVGRDSLAPRISLG